MQIETLEVTGFAPALRALRLPYSGEVKSDIQTRICREGNHLSETYDVEIAPADIKLLQTLIKRGDSHAKPMRGILAYAQIEAPIDWWVEAETYEAGRQRLFSASTMHTEGKALTGHALREAKNKISYGRPIKKIDFFSYQALRNMVYWRADHRLPEWHFFIEWVKTLPYADELILFGLEDRIVIHDKYLADYNAGII